MGIAAAGSGRGSGGRDVETQIQVSKGGAVGECCGPLLTPQQSERCACVCMLAVENTPPPTLAGGLKTTVSPAHCQTRELPKPTYMPPTLNIRERREERDSTGCVCVCLACAVAAHGGGHTCADHEARREEQPWVCVLAKKMDGWMGGSGLELGSQFLGSGLGYPRASIKWQYFLECCHFFKYTIHSQRPHYTHGVHVHFLS